MPNVVSSYLKFANLQMAAEAIFPDGFSDIIPQTILLAGNNRASKFPDALAEQFVADWAVVDHKANTSTGFSGTLFRARRDNADLGITAGELVISFRSTEFADDSARDTEATNKLEIQEFGWAFGQISDMQTWVQSLGISTSTPLTVTGYSLGGHLANAFYDLFPERRSSTAFYTFNGAGTGNIKSGTLADAISTFERIRISEDASDLFATTFGKEAYQATRQTLHDVRDLAALNLALLQLPTIVQPGTPERHSCKRRHRPAQLGHQSRDHCRSRGCARAGIEFRTVRAVRNCDSSPNREHGPRVPTWSARRPTNNKCRRHWTDFCGPKCLSAATPTKFRSELRRHLRRPTSLCRCQLTVALRHSHAGLHRGSATVSGQFEGACSDLFASLCDREAVSSGLFYE